MNTLKFVLPAILSAALLFGCAGESVVKPGEEGGAGTGATTEQGAQGIPLGQEGALPAEALDDPSSPLSKRIVYFDFDSSQVKPEYLDLVTLHGQFLAANPGVHVKLEGHTDERGTREYNVGLGERRAQAVERLLLLQGATRDQVELVSYGEELPAAMGHDEQSWSLNRRVELNYNR